MGSLDVHVGREVTAEDRAAAARLRRHFREQHPGGCRLLSEAAAGRAADGCTCPLCDIDRLVGLRSAGAEQALDQLASTVILAAPQAHGETIVDYAGRIGRALKARLDELDRWARIEARS